MVADGGGREGDYAELARTLDQDYRPVYGQEGSSTKFGFAALESGKLKGFCLLGVSSFKHARGYTGADCLPEFRGQGITPRSKPHLFYLGFRLIGLNRIETGCKESYQSSRRSIEKTPGFQYEGLLREFERLPSGLFEDERRYAIIRRDWEALNDAGAIRVEPL